jgi:hypothetical protein
VKNLIQASADQGDVVGQEFLAAYYAKESEFDKRGGDPDFLKALQLYEKSVVDGIPSAENNMLNLLRSNKNKMNDSEKSQMEKWFQNRAKNGDSNAARYLGFIYEDGTGLARNPELAKYYYGLAGDYRMQVDGSPITVQGLLSDGHFAFGGETTGWEIILNQPVTIGGNVVVRRLEVDNKKLSVDMAGKKFRMTGIFHWVRGIEVEERKIIYPNEIQPVNESGTQ